MNYNKSTLIGRVVKDIEVKATPSGTSVASFTIATNRYYKKDDEQKEETQFSDCVAFGKSAEVIGRYCKKGSLLMVVGRLTTRSWDDKETGKKRYKTEIHVEEFQLAPKNMATESKDSAKPDDAPIEYPDDEINPEDIPF